MVVRYFCHVCDIIFNSFRVPMESVDPLVPLDLLDLEYVQLFTTHTIT